MLDYAEITKCLLDSDGTTRDITFTPVEATGVRHFINAIRANYYATKASDANGNDVVSLFKTEWRDDTLSASEGYLHAVFEASEALIPVLQVFIDWPMENDRYGIELSFFPDDFDAKSFRVESFMGLIEAWCSVLGADDYFVRYENASWDWYDADGLGVIYTGGQMRTNKSD